MTDLAVDYCAFTVAIVLIWNPLELSNRPGQWSPQELAHAMQTTQYGQETNIYVNPLALHQGLHLFKKTIRLKGHELVQMNGTKNTCMIESFMGLSAVNNGYDIKFVPQDRISYQVNELEIAVAKMAGEMIRRYCGRDLLYKNLNEVSAKIFQSQLPNEGESPDLEVYHEPEPEPVPEVKPNLESVKKRRKMFADLGVKQMANCAKDVVSMISRTMCVNDEDATPFIIAALQTARCPDALDSIRNSIFMKDLSDDLKPVLDFYNSNDSVSQSITLLPKRNIVFTPEEKAHVLRIFDAIESVQNDLPDDHVMRTLCALI